MKLQRPTLFQSPLLTSRPQRALTTLALCSLLIACAGPADDISLIPAQTDQESSQQGLFAQPVKWTHTRPGCQGECPKIVVDSLTFPGNPRLSTLIDHALAEMTWLDEKQAIPYQTLAQFQAYFWKTANVRDEVDLGARLRYRNARLTVVELDASQYRTGMAHGISGSQFLNWDRQLSKALTLDALLRPGARDAFDQALREAHARWLESSPAAQNDPQNFARMWPFVSSDNVAITDQGLVVKYQPYEIAPYVAGQPELMIPYSRLRDILRPEFLPPSS